jgi:sarcosine oxidase subunit delta
MPLSGWIVSPLARLSTKPRQRAYRIEPAMLTLPCLHCGPRPEHEFRCGGESPVNRPPLAVSDDEWADYLFRHNNPKGETAERWCHSFGCGLWFNVVRNTVTHEIGRVYAITEPKPEPKS